MGIPPASKLQVTNLEPLNRPWQPGMLIRAARREHGLSQQDLAEITGISRSTIISAERGYRQSRGQTFIPVTMSADTLVKLAISAGADPEEVLRAAGVQSNVIAKAVPTLTIETDNLTSKDITLLYQIADLMKRANQDDTTD